MSEEPVTTAGTLAGQVEAVLAIHYRAESTAVPGQQWICHECCFEWPCRTVRALGVTR